MVYDDVVVSIRVSQLHGFCDDMHRVGGKMLHRLQIEAFQQKKLCEAL